MINFNNWREKRKKSLLETVAPEVTMEDDSPTEEDMNFYKTKLYGNLRRYLTWLVNEIQKSGGKLNLVRKGFIVQEVMDALGLTPSQVTRLSSNIKRAMQQAAQAQAHQGNSVGSSQHEDPQEAGDFDSTSGSANRSY